MPLADTISKRALFGQKDIVEQRMIIVTHEAARSRTEAIRCKVRRASGHSVQSR